MTCPLCDNKEDFIQRGKADLLTSEDFLSLCNAHWMRVKSLTDLLSIEAEEFETWLEADADLATA